MCWPSITPRPTRWPLRCAASLRPAIVCRIQQDRLLFDPRTVLPEQEETLLTALVAVLT
jgi:hypothetical protein